MRNVCRIFVKSTFWVLIEEIRIKKNTELAKNRTSVTRPTHKPLGYDRSYSMCSIFYTINIKNYTTAKISISRWHGVVTHEYFKSECLNNLKLI